MITFEEYIKEILNKFKLIQKDSSHQLNWLFEYLTPGSIRSASIEVFYERNGNSDKLILSAFFNISKEKDHFGYLSNTKAEKFLTVKNFLTGSTRRPKKEIVEFTAWLIDFQPRPYSNFLNNEGRPSENEEENALKIDTVIEKDKLNNAKTTEEVYKINEGSAQKDHTKNGNERILKKVVIIISLIGIVFLLYYFSNREQNNCMAWKEDQYERIACGKTSSPNLLYDQNLAENFKKVKLDTTMVFFKDGKALFWYDRTGGAIEFFTKGGRHPISNKILRPVTETIIRKYVFGEE